MADEEETVIGYPIDILFYHQAQPTLPTTYMPTTTSVTATTTNSMAIHNTPTTPPFTTRNRPNTNISSSSTTTTTTNNNKCTRDDIGGILFLLCIAGLIVLPIVFIVLSQQDVHLHNLKFEVDSVTVYPFNISSSHITANWNFIFSITNPNDLIFYYDNTWASVFYKDKNISSTRIESFFHELANKRLVHATIVASSVYVNNSVAKDIVADWSRGVVNFTLTVNATTRISPGTEWEQQKQMTVSCEDVKVGFSLDMTVGTMLGGSRECSVSLHKLNT